MDIDKVYKFLQYISNKSQSGYLTPSDFNLSIGRALSEWVMKAYGNPLSKNPNKRGYEKDQKSKDDLRFLLVTNKLSYVGTDGALPLPDDYLHLSSIKYNYKYLDDGVTQVKVIKVNIADDNEIASFLESDILSKRIKAKLFIVAALFKDFIQFYPSDVQQVDLTYLRKPVNPLWAFTVVNGKPKYDQLNSIDLEAPDEVANEIIMMAASYLGMNLREPELIQYSEMLKDQGV